jgi:peptide/nickel transport system permease protein
MVFEIIRRFFFALLVFVGAGILVALLLSLVPDYAKDEQGISFFGRAQENLTTFFTFSYDRTKNENLPIGQVLRNCGVTSLTFIGGALALVFLIGAPAGIFAALHRESRIWKFLTKGIYALSALPTLVWAAFLLLLAAKLFHFLPVHHELSRQNALTGRLLIYLLPIAALAFGDGILSDVVRVLREETAKIVEQDFIRALRARGVGLTRHVLRSLIIPITSVFTGKISLLIAGTVVVEYVFNWRGLGFEILEAVSATGAKDYPVILAATMLFVGVIILLNFAGEVAAILSDPRLRKQ